MNFEYFLESEASDVNGNDTGCFCWGRYWILLGWVFGVQDWNTYL